jgi:hypothetical protein
VRTRARTCGFARYLYAGFGDDAALLKAGYSQCSAFDSGGAADSLRVGAVKAGAKSVAAEAILISAATNLCPEYADRLR